MNEAPAVVPDGGARPPRRRRGPGRWLALGGAAAVLLGGHVAGGAASLPGLADDRDAAALVAPESSLQEAPACLECHRHFKARLARQAYLHRPVQEGRCLACHASDGGASRRLVDRFPEERHLPFRREAYALCWRCHDAEAILGEAAPVRTGFRNGSRNLHAEHVNRAVKGRSCASCHDVHGADQEKLVRARSLAKRLLEMTFTRSHTGGRCMSNCHKPLAYDRLSPVKY